MFSARQTSRLAVLPLGLANAAATYQDALRGKFVDQIADQLPPTVNMLHISRGPGTSLQTILEENPDSESKGSMEPLAETFTKQPPLLPFWGGAIFNVSIDSPPRNGEIDEERATRENRNANRAQRHDNERAIAMAEAARDNQFDSQGRPLHRNLNEEFLRVDGHDVFKTPSANLAVVANKLAHLP